MGPMLFAGLACFGAAIGQGLIVSRTSAGPPSPTGATSRVRGLGVILMAFVQGTAVLGVVVGIIAIIHGAVGSPTDGLYAAGPAIVGAIIGGELIVLRLKTADRGVVTIGAAFILAIALLGITPTLLLVAIDQTVIFSVSDPPFVILGALTGAAALGIGVTGAGAVKSLASADDQAALRIRATQIARSTPLQGVSMIATVIAILLLTIH